MTAATMKDAFEGAEVFKMWPAPDMSVLNQGRRAPVPMPGELLGPVWPLISAVAEGTASPVDYAAGGFLTACASLIGGKRRVRPYQSSPWSEPCILWMRRCRRSQLAQVAGAGPGHRTPAQPRTRPCRTAQGGLARAGKPRSSGRRPPGESGRGQVKEAVKYALPTPDLPDDAVDPDEPHRRRTLVMDATPEAVGAILAGNPMGTLHFRDELAGWLMSFDRYSPGGREFWLEAYGGRSFVDRPQEHEGTADDPV